MDIHKFPPYTRRDFLNRVTALGAAGVLGAYPELARAEPPPETTSIRIVHDPTIPVLC